MGCSQKTGSQEFRVISGNPVSHWQAPSLRSDHRGQSPGCNGVLSTAPGMESDLPGFIKQQETRTGLQTWLQPGSESYAGQRDIGGTQPRHSYCITDMGEQPKLNEAPHAGVRGVLRGCWSGTVRASISARALTIPLKVMDSSFLLFKMWFI